MDIRQVASRHPTCPTRRPQLAANAIIDQVIEEWAAERIGPDGRSADILPHGDRWAVIAYWYGEVVGSAIHKTVSRAHRAGVAFAQRARIPGQPRQRRTRRKRARRRTRARR